MDIAYTEYTQMISMWIESKQYAELSLNYSKATAFFAAATYLEQRQIIIQREVKSVVTGVALVIVCSFINEKNLN